MQPGYRQGRGVRKPIAQINGLMFDLVARAASEGGLRLPVGEIVPLSEAVRLIGELEAGRKIEGKGLIAME